MLIYALSFKTSSRDPDRPKQLPLAPGSKYLLVRFAQYFGKEICTLSLRELAKQFGISELRASDALLELTREGCFERSSIPGDHGRPRNHYRLTEATCTQIKKAPRPQAPHVATIARLIVHERSGAIREGQCMEKPNALSGRQPGRLSTVDRLLLSVLLCHADQFGAVYDLSFADLYQLTGIKADVTKSKVHRLLNLGFIRSYVPGATSKTMFGKVKSTYVLNLQSPELSGLSPLLLLIDFSIGDKSSGLDNEAKMLFLRSARASASARAKKNQTWEETTEPQLLAQIGEFFRQKERRTVQPILQHRLDLYASLMLTDCWSLLPVRAHYAGSPEPDFMPVLRERIAEDFQPPGKIHSEGKGFPTKKQHDMLIDQLFGDAFRIACHIRYDFSEVNTIDLQGMKFLLLPRHVYGVKNSGCLHYRSMLVMPQNSTLASGCYLMSDQRDLVRLECEPVLPVGPRYLAALIALGKTNTQDKGA